MSDKATPKVQDSEFRFKCDWKNALEDSEFVKTFSTEILEDYILKKRWYAGKASTLKYIDVVDHSQLISDKNIYYGILIEINFSEAFFQNYFIPLSFISDSEGPLETNTIIAKVNFKGKEGYLIDALHIEDFRKLVFNKVMGSSPEPKHEKIIFHRSETLEARKI